MHFYKKNITFYILKNKDDYIAVIYKTGIASHTQLFAGFGLFLSWWSGLTDTAHSQGTPLSQGWFAISV